MTSRVPICGVTFCESCGDCLACYNGDGCGGEDHAHSWPDDPADYDEELYEQREAKLKAECDEAMERARQKGMAP